MNLCHFTRVLTLNTPGASAWGLRTRRAPYVPGGVLACGSHCCLAAHLSLNATIAVPGAKNYLFAGRFGCVFFQLLLTAANK